MFAKILLLQHNQHFYLDVSVSIRDIQSEEVCSIPLPVLATIVMRRGKKLVVRVAQRVAPLVLVQGLPSFFPNMYCLFDPSSTLSDCLSKIVEAGQLITWLSWDAWQVSADLYCSDRLDARWFPVKSLLIMDSTCGLRSFNLPNFLPVKCGMTVREM